MTLFEIYKSQGEEMVWIWNYKGSKPVKIKHLNTLFIKNKIDFLMKNNIDVSSWFYIFQDVLLKRRVKKINKIKQRYTL